MSQEVRVAVQHALDKLINRFGKQSDVIAELRHALKLIDKGNEVPASPQPEPEQPPAPAPVEPDAVEEEAVEPEAKPSPRARKGMGRKK